MKEWVPRRSWRVCCGGRSKSDTIKRGPSASSPARFAHPPSFIDVGNHDAHGKSFSLLYLPSSSSAVLAPAYDALSSTVYGKVQRISRKMAMSIGGEYRPDYVRSRHLDRMLGDAGLGVAAARRRLRGMAAEATAAARAAQAALAAEGWDAAVATQVVEVVERSATRLAEIAAPAARTTR